MNSTANQTSATTSQTAGPRQRSRLATALWIVLALVIALVATGIYLPPHVHLSVPKLLAIWLGGAFLGYIGVRIGDGVRRIA
ncbi:hypothetical protein EN817_32220, partial [Mesorhizobium sp. M3A.F.Ca.ET.174.01.1.1]|uniref:hypothetical protein n=1 Tax=Mesorhizobium sp. M3A.F.Ca.ET.174.01.1.1 TaxID=2563944 RepID=UPI001093FF65